MKPVLEYASARGIDVEDLLAATGIDSAKLNSPETRLTLEEMDCVYRQAMRYTGDDNLGLHVGECFAIGTMDIVGHILMNCRTIGEHLEKLMEYVEIVSQGMRIILHREDEGRIAVETAVLHAHGPLMRQHVECLFSGGMKLASYAVGDVLAPIEVRFKHKAPRELAEHRRIFQAPVLFGHSMNAMVWNEGFLDIPIRQPNPELLRLFEQHAKQVLNGLQSDKPLAKKVGRILFGKLQDGYPSIEDIAGELSMGVRNLQKKLEKENTSYRKILDEICCGLAVSYLRDVELSIADIAYLLGFSEPSAFHRSFKRWTGLTPTEYRNS